ncbi:MAG: hypothetical protein ACREBS_03380, partial [Nitrososphaerales archaeon]
GGGYGDPLARDPKKVLSDVISDYVSLNAAREIYGVIIDESNWRIDEEATKKQRAKLKSSRIFCRAIRTSEQFIGRRRCAHVNSHVLERLDISRDEPIELVGNTFAPLRVWPVPDYESESDIGIDEVSMRIIKVKEGDLLCLRDPNQLIKVVQGGS